MTNKCTITIAIVHLLVIVQNKKKCIYAFMHKEWGKLNYKIM